MRAFSVLAVFAIVSASALAAPRPRLQLGSITKELVRNVADTDFDRTMDQTVITWAQVQLEVLNHSQQIEALLTGAGHDSLWTRCQNVISQASDKANAIFEETIKAADPNASYETFFDLLVFGGYDATGVLTEAIKTVGDLIETEAQDVFPQAAEILNHAEGQIYAAFAPLIELFWSILFPEN